MNNTKSSLNFILNLEEVEQALEGLLDKYFDNYQLVSNLTLHPYIWLEVFDHYDPGFIYCRLARAIAKIFANSW